MKPLDSVSPETGRRRYLGTRPYTDSLEDRARFFGRAEESKQLYLRVLSVPLLVQFGRSGLGKTSLLQAGLFPLLRQKPFLPVMVRLNAVDDSLTAAVVASMRQACDSEGLEFAPNEAAGLWELLKTTTVWRDDLLLTPVLVFDQFEEVFTLRDAAFRAELAAELGALASGIAPSRATAAAPPPRVKIVISLREDYLGALEEFAAAIPGLFHERLRLRPLGEDGARDAITKPAQLIAARGEEPYWSPPFAFDPPAMDAMVADQKGKSGVIEPFQLQLVCQHAETTAHQKARGGGGKVTLTLDDLGGVRSFRSVRQNFYRDTLRKLKSGSQRRRAETLCEDGLLGAGGHRLSLEEGQVLRDFGVTKETLDTLCQERLIVRERRLESVFYEISHDRLAESIYDARRVKIPRQLKRFLWIAAAAAVLIIGVLLWWNEDVRRERVRAERARAEADEMLSFMLGEEFLGEVRDIGRSSLLEKLQPIVKGGGQRALNRGLALRNEGDISRTHGDLKTALVNFTPALRAIESDFETGADHVREVARTHDRLGDAFAAKGEVDQALQHYTQSTSAWQRVAGDPTSDADDCTDLADSLVTLGELKMRMGDTQPAVQDLESGAQVATNLLFGVEPSHPECGGKLDQAAPYPDPRALHVLSRAAYLRWLIDGTDENVEGAAALANHARMLRPLSDSIRRNALLALTYRGNERRPRSPQAALDDYRTALDEFEDLHRWDPTNRFSQRSRAACVLLVVHAIVSCHTQPNADCKQPPSLRDAEAMSLEAIAALEALAAEDSDNASLKSDLVWNLRASADVLAAQNRHEERFKRLKEADGIYRHMTINAGDADTRADFARLLAAESEALEALGRTRESVGPLSDAIARYRQLVASHPSNLRYAGDLAELLKHAATLLPKTGDAQGGAAAAAEGQQLADSVAASFKKGNDALAALLQVGDSSRARGADSLELDAPAAVVELNAAISAARNYLRARPAAITAYESLEQSYALLDEAQEKLKVPAERTATTRASMYAVQIAAWLAPPARQMDMNTNLLTTRSNFADRLYDQKRYQEAVPVAQEIVAVAEDLAQSNTNDPRNLQLLGRAKCSLGNYRRLARTGGWEQAIRSGLIHLGDAAALRPREFSYARDLAAWRKYLAEQLDEQNRKQEATEEYQRAMGDYRKAEQLGRNEEIRRAIAAVAKRLNGTARAQ